MSVQYNRENIFNCKKLHLIYKISLSQLTYHLPTLKAACGHILR